MEIQDLPTATYPAQRRKSVPSRFQKSTLIILLIIGIIGIIIIAPILFLTVMKIWTISSPHTVAIDPTRVPIATLELSPSPSPTLGPRPTSTPVPLPIKPFPLMFAQQKAVMQAKDRFFYQGNRKLSEIALTFDDGPNPPYTNQVLDILRHYGVKATFFCVGAQVARYPDLVRREYSEGHAVGNHTWGHPNMSLLTSASIIWQLTTAGDAIQQVIGVRPTLFRPPYGSVNSNVLTYANYFGLTVIQWNVDPLDWSKPGADVIYARVLAQTRPGSIILMHDGGGERSQTITALPRIIAWFQKHNFHFVTVPHLIHDVHLVPGRHTSVPE